MNVIIKRGFEKLIELIPYFDLIDSKLVPEGLKPHTRSICWIAEQIVLQNLRANSPVVGFAEVSYPDSDIDVWDCKIRLQTGEIFYVNVKVTNVNVKKGRNDISKAPALVKFFTVNPQATLLDVVIQLRFDNTRIYMNAGNVIVFDVVKIPNLYVNPSNHHLQAEYSENSVSRTTEEFLSLLMSQLNSKGIRF